MTLCLLISGGIVIWANFRQQPYALESLISLLTLLVTSWFFYPLYYDQTLFVAFTFFIVINLYTLSKSVGALRHQLEETLEQAKSLQIALLKKNIQPHYLMNTLTSLISWVEESPQAAIKFIEALAVEFDYLREVAEKKKIPIKEEILLCRSHLQVMHFRNEIHYQLNTKNIDEEEAVPPACSLRYWRTA